MKEGEAVENSFDPYHKWLGIPPREQPPNHYRLLGVQLFESDHDVIEAAAERQMVYLHQVNTGPYLSDSQRILNEVAASKVCLLDEGKKKAYDAKLNSELSPPSRSPKTIAGHGGVSTKPDPVPQSQRLGHRLRGRTATPARHATTKKFLIPAAVSAFVVIIWVIVDSQTPTESPPPINPVLVLPEGEAERLAEVAAKQVAERKAVEKAAAEKRVDDRLAEEAATAKREARRLAEIAAAERETKRRMAEKAAEDKLKAERLAEKNAEGTMALRFDGKSSYVQIPPLRGGYKDSLVIEADATLTAFPSNGTAYVVSNLQDSGFGLAIKPDHHWHFFIHDREGYVDVKSNEPVRLGEVYQLAGIVEDNQVSLYVNGRLQGSPIPMRGSFNSSSMPLLLGADPERKGKKHHYLTGIISRVKISREVDDLKQHLQEPSTRWDRSSVALYAFDEGKGNTLNDATGNQNVGEIVGARWVKYENSRVMDHVAANPVDTPSSPVQESEFELANKSSLNWTIIFRSSDPLIWNTSTNDGPDRFAIPVDQAPEDTRWIRLKNTASGDAVYIQVRFEDIGKNVRVGLFRWCGKLEVENRSADGKPQNNATLGIANINWPQRYTPGAQVGVYVGRITVDRKGASGYRGWGFGKHSHVYSPQCWTWEGQEILKDTIFEIAVAPDLKGGFNRKNVLSRRWRQ